MNRFTVEQVKGLRYQQDVRIGEVYIEKGRSIVIVGLLETANRKDFHVDYGVTQAVAYANSLLEGKE